MQRVSAKEREKRSRMFSRPAPFIWDTLSRKGLTLYWFIPQLYQTGLSWD